MKRDKPVVKINVPGLLAYLSGLSVSACSVNKLGHVHVLIHRGQGQVRTMDSEKMEKLVGSPEVLTMEPRSRPFIVSATCAKSAKLLLSHVTGLHKRDDQVDRAYRNPEVAGHLGRIRDQVVLSVRHCAAERKEVREGAVRKDIRDMLDKCGKKYQMSRSRVVKIFLEEADLIAVDEVMKS